MPRAPPSLDRAPPKVRVIHSTMGKAPIRTMPIWPQTSRPLFSGVMPRSGSTVDITSNTGNMMPVICWNTAMAVRTVMTTVTPVPNLLKPLIMGPGANHRPMTIRAAMTMTGTRLIMFMTRPPTMQPMGMVIIPARTPAPR